MKKLVYGVSCCILASLLLANCGTTKMEGSSESGVTPAQNDVPEYKVLDNPQVNLRQFKKDKDGYVVIFNGTDFTGWRGYGKDHVPSKWIIEDGAIKFNASGGVEGQNREGGDIIFAHKFKNFELEFEWKVAKGSNSGVFYLAQEIEAMDAKTGKMKMQPIYISAPEAQILDNENHPDAKLGKDNNRKSLSLYDMIPAVPQNAKPFGEWNSAKIKIHKGTVVHAQNGEKVLEYDLWTQPWIDMLQASKFSQQKWPLAFELLKNCGGKKREGYIGLQDHGNDVWFRNIRVKVLD